MIGVLILASAVLLSWVIGLNLWQSVVVILFSMGVYLTGRRMGNGRKEN